MGHQQRVAWQLRKKRWVILNKGVKITMNLRGNDTMQKSRRNHYDYYRIYPKDNCDTMWKNHRMLELEGALEASDLIFSFYR